MGRILANCKAIAVTASGSDKDPKTLMTLHSVVVAKPEQMARLGKAAAALGYEIVDIAGFLDLVESHAVNQRTALTALGESAGEMASANEDVQALVRDLSVTSATAMKNVQSSVALVRKVGDKTRDVAGWVQHLSDRTCTITDTLRAVKANNSQIAAIAMQVNTLAINAKIEAARAGDAGRGFAVVADAINDLSQKTGTAAKQISENIERLNNWITDLGQEAEGVAENATEVLSQSEETDAALGAMETTIKAEYDQAQQIAAQTERANKAMSRLRPSVKQIDATVRETSAGIERTHARMFKLIDLSEMIVQCVGSLGAESHDARFVAFMQKTGQAVSEMLDTSLDVGAISMARLFDRRYIPVSHTDPPQVTTQATVFLDDVLPPFQEPALDFDPCVVFCAAVDTNGYLPTHNHKFSKPQTNDVVWNTAHSRNRRMFNDRVGLKAGRSQAPFLLQVYRRDMGGGDFRVMKDLSVPIRVKGLHWGALRMGYT